MSADERPQADRQPDDAGQRLATDGGGLRKHRRRPFVALDAEVVYAPGLSMRAKLLLAQMLDRPEKWRFSIDWFATVNEEGRDAVRTAGKELKRAGYYRVESHRHPDGRVISVAQVADFPVQEWADDFARYGERAIPHVVDVSGELRRLPARGDLASVPSPSVPDSSPGTDDGFPGVGSPGVGSPGAGSPGAGSPGVGSPGVLTQTETPDGNQMGHLGDPPTTRASAKPVDNSSRVVDVRDDADWRRVAGHAPPPSTLPRRRSRAARDVPFLARTPAFADRAARGRVVLPHAGAKLDDVLGPVLGPEPPPVTGSSRRRSDGPTT